MKQDDIRKGWYRTAWSRLRFELSGLSFALKWGATPEDYADYLWSGGAVKWMGKANPTLQEYLDKETEAIRALYPQVIYTLGKITDKEAELTFAPGCCLGGWGRDQWGLAGSLGLEKAMSAATAASPSSPGQASLVSRLSPSHRLTAPVFYG